MAHSSPQTSRLPQRPDLPGIAELCLSSVLPGRTLLAIIGVNPERFEKTTVYLDNNDVTAVAGDLWGYSYIADAVARMGITTFRTTILITLAA